MDINKMKNALTKYILYLESEIAIWRSKNSQSNPGAMMELREMKKSLSKAQATLEALSHYESGTSS